MTSVNFFLTTLSLNPEYFEEVIHLIEDEFHYNNENSYEKDFAPLLDPHNFENCFLYIDNETNLVAAHLAICIRTLIKDGIETQVALIGGIVTNKRYRGKKLFKNLMDHVYENYKNQVSLFILWSDIEGLYERFNFYRSGGIIETGKKNLNATDRPNGYEKTKFTELTDKDFARIIHLYSSFNEKIFFTIKREEKDWSILKQMSSIDLYVKRSSFDEIQKYFCINKGQDLANIIHEISCTDSNEYLLMLHELEKFRIWLPETESNKVKNREIFYNAFIKMGDKNQLNKFLGKVFDNQFEIKEFNTSMLSFEFKKIIYSASEKEFLQFLFGPRPLEEFIPYNLSLYIPGADSI